ncbi:MAG: response regulator [Acidobacteriota bacterium]|nr:response regulator [Acidobacteriota bacterium]
MITATLLESETRDGLTLRRRALADSSGPGVNRPTLRVLVVDDEALIRWSVTETLTGLGMTVDQAVDAASALRAIDAARWRFDVIVLDLRLPDMNDLTLLAAIRRRVPHAAVVLMTAFGTPEIVTAAYDLGVVNVLNKPFELDELSRVVKAAGETATC